MAYQRLDDDPDPASVRTMTFVPFLPDGTCTAVATATGRVALPAGPVLAGEHYLLDTSLRIPLHQAGFRMRRVHPVAVDGDRVYAWLAGQSGARQRHTFVARPGTVAGRLAAAGRHDQARSVRDAVRSLAAQDEAGYFADTVRLLEPAYLRTGTAEGGSGFDGGPELWRARRQNVLAGVAGSGTFLDLGCANGYLMESVHAWAAERGLDLRPSGIDLAPGLVAEARRRLPSWADRIETGNALTWWPADGRQFDYVHLLLDLVPAARRADLLTHAACLARPGGRLLISHYLHEGSTDRPVRAQLRALRVEPTGVDPAGQTAWINVPDGAEAWQRETSVRFSKSY